MLLSIKEIFNITMWWLELKKCLCFRILTYFCYCIGWQHSKKYVRFKQTSSVFISVLLIVSCNGNKWRCWHFGDFYLLGYDQNRVINGNQEETTYNFVVVAFYSDTQVSITIVRHNWDSVRDILDWDILGLIYSLLGYPEIDQ